jgi:phosphoribosylformylglycinamidine synthase
VSRRYRFETDTEIPAETKTKIAFALHDKMTEQIYDAPMQSFESTSVPEPVTYVPILAEGRAALDRINSEWGLGMDEDDVNYYTGLFKDKMKRCDISIQCTYEQHILTHKCLPLLQRPHEC